MMDLSNLEKSGVTVRKFCGLEVEESIGCPNEAVGDLTITLEDGQEVPIPVCQGHLDVIRSEYDVQG
jgi:hypothetical protein